MATSSRDTEVFWLLRRENWVVHEQGVIEDVIDSMAGERLLHILHTREGSLAASFLFIAASAKHRKQIVKALKSKVSQVRCR